MTRDVLVEVVTESRILERVGQLGKELSEDYGDRNPLFVGILHGSFVFIADLLRSLSIPAEVDFMSLTRFGSEGRVGIAMDTETPLSGRHVVIVEDIVDTGLTLTTLHRLLELRDVASLSTVALIDKAPRRIVEVPVEYRGFEVGDEFLLGYGLDWEGRYRNLRSLWAVMDLAILTDDALAIAPLVYPGAHPGTDHRSGDSLDS